jgi:hypothetical protein
MRLVVAKALCRIWPRLEKLHSQPCLGEPLRDERAGDAGTDDHDLKGLIRAHGAASVGLRLQAPKPCCCAPAGCAPATRHCDPA